MSVPADDTTTTIFVSIASYRDKLCPITLSSIYRNADRPDSVSVGLCQQNRADTDDDCVETMLRTDPALRAHRCRVRVLRLRHTEARGPTYARYLCSTMYDGESFYLQIDSHCKFVRHWDTLLIGMIRSLEDAGIPKPVLSHYTPGYEDYTESPPPQSPVTTICKAFFYENNLLSLEGAGTNPPGPLPKPNAYIAAGMFFCRGSFLQEIPFDPELDHVFIGEELMLSARFYTHGWDIFTPNRNTIYHMYTRADEPRFWENPHNDASQATEKIRYHLGLVPTTEKLTPRQIHMLEEYGMGTERLLSDFFAFAGIDLDDRVVQKNMCTLSHDELWQQLVEPFVYPPPHDDPLSPGSRWPLFLLAVLLLLLLPPIILWYSRRPPPAHHKTRHKG